MTVINKSPAVFLCLTTTITGKSWPQSLSISDAHGGRAKSLRESVDTSTFIHPFQQEDYSRRVSCLNSTNPKGKESNICYWSGSNYWHSLSFWPYSNAGVWSLRDPPSYQYSHLNGPEHPFHFGNNIDGPHGIITYLCLNSCWEYQKLTKLICRK